MKTYKDIGDLYREKFSGYAPEPPVGVWEHVQSAASRKPTSVKGKIGIFAAAATVVAAAAFFLVDRSSVEDRNIENPPAEQIIAETVSSKVVDTELETAVVSQNRHSVEAPKRAETAVLPAEAREVERVETFSVSTHNNNSVSEPTSPVVAPSPIQQKTEQETIVENAKIKEKTEAVPAKTLPIVVSKDTTVCENARVKLFVLNAKDVRWSTGEVKNSIFVNPSSDEQYSATFTTENHRDTTVFIHIKCIRCSEMYIPNAFTPNGDGRNDVFTAQSAEEYPFFEMTIYSIDGKQLLFTSRDIKRGWDGTYKGVLQPHGAYRYVVRYQDAAGKMNEKQDYLLLILK